MADVANIKQVTGLVLQSPPSLTEIANALAYSRSPSAPGVYVAGGGGESDPVGPQRWPLKL